MTHWENNKLDRTKNSRMGWSDLSICMRGPVVEDLKAHFVERWNFIFDEKYNVRKDERYSRLAPIQGMGGPPPPQEGARGGEEGERGFGHHGEGGGFGERMRGEFGDRFGQIEDRFGAPFEHGGHHGQHHQGQQGQGQPGPRGGVACQKTRSCSKWSNGTETEVSFPAHHRVSFAICVHALQ